MSRQLRSPLALLLLCLVFAAAPLVAGTVYVPVLSDNGLDDTRYVTRIWLTNLGNGPQTVETFFVPMRTDGTEGRQDQKSASTITVRAGRTSVIELGGEAGMLEITTTGDTPDRLAIKAELRHPGHPGAEKIHPVVPVLSANNLGEPGGTLVLQGLRRTTAGVVTNVILANLGHKASQCTVKVFRPNGQQIAGTALLSFKPLSQVQYPDALDILGEVEGRDVHLTASCDQPFYGYLATYETQTGEALLIEPAATGDSALAPPGEEAPSVPGAVLFTQNGTFHQPVPGNPTRIFNIGVDKDETYSRVTVDLDVFHGGWHRQSNHNHSLFWLHRGAYGGHCCWPKWAGNILGYANAFGPGRNEVKVATSMDLPPHHEQVAFKRGVALEPGNTYHLHYVYDAAQGFFDLTVTHQGQEVVKMRAGTTTSAIRPDHSGTFMIYFGHELENPEWPERPTFGWKYSNLRVEFIP